MLEKLVEIFCITDKDVTLIKALFGCLAIANMFIFAVIWALISFFAAVTVLAIVIALVFVVGTFIFLIELTG